MRIVVRKILNPSLFGGKKTLAVGLTIILAFSSVETLLRVRQLIKDGSFFDVQSGLFIKDPVLGNVLRPGAKIISRSSSLTVNKWGLRGHDFPLQKEKGVFRIVVLGDSVVFERYALNDDTTWAARLEKELNSSQDRYRVEVINAGMAGFKINNAYLYLTDKISRFKPDMIILYQGVNDINYQSRILYSPNKGEDREAGLIDLQRIREKYFIWYGLLRDRTASLLASGQKAARIDKIDQAAVNNYADGLRKIIEYCKKNKIILVPSTIARSFRRNQPELLRIKMASSMVVYNPYLSIGGLEDAFDRFNGAIRNLSKQNNLDLVDNDSNIPADEKYFRDHVHFTDAGDKLVADVFAKEILRKYLN